MKNIQPIRSSRHLDHTYEQGKRKQHKASRRFRQQRRKRECGG
jgi:hypothetical protein